MPGIHVKNSVFEGRLQHKALVEISRNKPREHNFVSINFIVLNKKDLGVIIVSIYDTNGYKFYA
jgi:hypothetical protein